MQTSSKNRGIGSYTRELINALAVLNKEDKIIPTSHDYFSLGADLVHFPFFDPFFLTLPLRRPLPTVVTIHDLIPLKYPSHFPRGLKGEIKWRLQKLKVKGVEQIVTDSQASKQDIVRILGVSKDKVTVIPLASASDPLEKSMIPKVKLAYSLPERFILYVGDINWNKNVVGLINNFSRLDSKSTHLVLVGKSFVGPVVPELRAIKRAISKSQSKDRIHLIGYVPSHHLPAVYRLADIYCQPSLDEGFGLTLLEAMKVGCPVVSSDRGSLKEVGGPGALYFDPEKNMLAALNKALSSRALRAKLSALGTKRSKEFTWEKTATLTHKVYEKVLRGR